MPPQTIADFPYTDSPPRVECSKCHAAPDTPCTTPRGAPLRTLFHDARYSAASAADRTPPSLRPIRPIDLARLRQLRTVIFDHLADVLSDEADDRAHAAEHRVAAPYTDSFIADRPRCLDLIAVIGRSDATAEDFARVANEVLAWDSESFVALCGVDSSDIWARDITSADWEQLARLNGGRPFTYNLHDWSTW